MSTSWIVSEMGGWWLEQAARGIDLCVNTNKTVFLCFKQAGAV